jgi:activator of the mannose operon (transcriptional antiterminator)
MTELIERHKNLIQLLLRNKHLISANEIANYLKVSNRTIRNDVKQINNESMPNLILSVKGRGYKLNIENYSIDKIEKYVSDFELTEHYTLIKIAYDLLMHKEQTTLEDISHFYHISKLEVLTMLNKIKSWAQTYDITLHIAKRKGVIITGNEMDVRNAILHLNQLTGRGLIVGDLILEELPSGHVNVLLDIIKEILEKKGINVSEFQINQLLIHFIIIIKRQNKVDKKWEVNQNALKIAQEFNKAINERLKYNLNEETARLFSFFISYHFNRYDLGLASHFVQIYVDRLIYNMEGKIGIPFTRDQQLNKNLYFHLSRTYMRIAKKIYINNPLTQEIRNNYPFIFHMLYETVKHLEDDSGMNITEDEIAFLALHFQSSIDRNTNNKTNVVITCYYGLGISSLLETKIGNLDSQINVIKTLNFDELADFDFTGIDLLITTHDNNSLTIPRETKLIKVSPLFTEVDERKVLSFVRQKNNQVTLNEDIDSIKFTVITHFEKDELGTKIFETAKSILNESNDVKIGYIESAIEREKYASTYIGNGIAIPHGNPDKVMNSHIIIFKNKNGYIWKQYNVKLVCFLAITESDIPAMKKIIHTLTLFEEKEYKNWLLIGDEQFKKQFIQLINK